MMTPGETLENGAVVVDVAIDDHGHTFVLAVIPDRGFGHDPYATWEVVRGVTVSGHYCQNLTQALGDFHERLGWSKARLA